MGRERWAREELKIFSTFMILVGLIVVGLGVALGVAYGDTLGAMVGLLVGIAVVVEGAWLLDGMR